jgi:hypothetical protein
MNRNEISESNTWKMMEGYIVSLARLAQLRSRPLAVISLSLGSPAPPNKALQLTARLHASQVVFFISA